jgi:hypothetical protein
MSSRHETFVQWTKIALLGAILALVFWNIGTRPPSVSAQLAGSAGFSYAHITTATNTPIKSASGNLHVVVVNTPAGIVTIKDTTAADCSGGTTVAVTGTLATIGQTISYDIQTNSGLCITTSGAADLTVAWR